MSKLALIATNLVTATVTVAVTSLFWIAAYQNGGKRVPEVEADSETEIFVPTPAEPAPRASPVFRKQAAATKTVRYALVLGPTGLALPVLGINQSALSDTYKQARAGGARVHDAIDIMAPAGRPVVAAAPGTVEKLFFSAGGGGISAYIRSNDGRWSYYYAHLQNYAPGLREGLRVNRGTWIGSVGATGNANPEGPHLHFAIHQMQQGERWHQGTPINPYPLLASRKAH